MTVRPFSRRIAFVAAVTGTLAIAACGGGSPVPGVSRDAAPAAVRAGTYDAWRSALTRVPLGGAGCYKATYPALAWSRVACSASTILGFPFHARRGVRPHVPNDQYTAVAPGNDRISAAIGSFPSATVTSERTVNVNGSTGSVGPNSYTLQINSNVFSTAVCKGVANCGYGWVQFVYTNPPNAAPTKYPRPGQLNVWDWLEPINRKPIACPKNAGWIASSPYCYQVSPTIEIPNQAIGGNALAAMTLEGTAGTTDSVYLTVGPTTYAIEQAQRDGITDLAENWTQTEFNIYGNDNGSVAKFTAGSRMTVSVQTNLGAGVTTAPKCSPVYTTTAESNTLNYVAPPANPSKLKYPSILFAQSAASGGTPSCKTLAGST